MDRGKQCYIQCFLGIINLCRYYSLVDGSVSADTMCSRRIKLFILIVLTHSIFIVRRVPPHFKTAPPERIEIQPNSSVSIPCMAVGSPMPLVKWRKGYQDLFPQEEALRGKNTLNLTNVLESANFTCVAQSELGNIEAEVQVIVTGKGAIVNRQKKSYKVLPKLTLPVYKLLVLLHKKTRLAECITCHMYLMWTIVC